MKVALLLLGLCAIAIAVPPSIVPKKYKIADKAFLEKQKTIISLFKYINQPSYYKEFIEISQTFSLEQSYSLWTNPFYVQEFLKLYKQGFLVKGAIFSPFYEEHIKQAQLLFKIFYYAKDWDTLYKTAVWARQYVSEGLFVYSFSIALIHRPDTSDFILPVIYETIPYYFLNSDVINKIQKVKQVYGQEPAQTSSYNLPGEQPYENNIIVANYSGWYLNLNPEQSLAYFTEDIGINAYYYYYNLYYPYWMDGKEFGLTKDKRGELYYFIHQQLLARYYLERLSNDVGAIPALKASLPVETGYYPSLVYPNGLPFPPRPNNVQVTQYWGSEYFANFTDTYTYVKDYARRIRDAIDFGYVYTGSGEKVYLYDSNGMEILGNLIQSNPDSPNTKFYGSLQIYLSYLLGYSYPPLSKYYLAPSVLEQFETSLRDPVFYQYMKLIVQLFQKYKYNLPYYTYQELEFPGVKIESITTDRLITYFEPFFIDVSAAAYYNEKEFESYWPIKALQYRLNHKPFTFTINVLSEKPVDAIVKVFIGPKYDEFGKEIDITKNAQNFVLFDKFLYKLSIGKNSIVRSSQQNYFLEDRTTTYDLYKSVLNAYKGQEPFHIESETYFGFPNRFLLPKGKLGGQTYQFYAYIMPYTQTPYTQTPYTQTPYTPYSTVHSYRQTSYGQYPYIPNPYIQATYPGSSQGYYEDPKVGTGKYLLDDKPFGYPLDRFVSKYDFYVPNSYFYDVVIYHKKLEDLNISTNV